MDIKKAFFGQLKNSAIIDSYILSNSRGLKAKLMTYGAALISLEVPDRNGRSADIVLGYDSLEGYIKKSPYFGATIGRCANRISKGRFVLDGVEYKLAINDGENHLHGGLKGFDKVVWKAGPVRLKDAVGVKFTHASPDGAEGYPGNLVCAVIYALSEQDELRISYEAGTDKATPINLTHHSYFNLAGQGSGDILGHELMINADEYTRVDESLIPTGEMMPVVGTPMDFRVPVAIGARIAQVAGGYDHNYVLKKGGGGLSLAARVHEPASGRIMEVSTTEPGLQLYCGNFLDGTIIGKSGRVYYKHYGFCLETQHFPDSPNKPNFPSTILLPGKKYTSLTVHKFSTK
jgi:aldose 1-epimerase